jgi:hypothetical protein
MGIVKSKGNEARRFTYCMVNKYLLGFYTCILDNRETHFEWVSLSYYPSILEFKREKLDRLSSDYLSLSILCLAIILLNIWQFGQTH